MFKDNRFFKLWSQCHHSETKNLEIAVALNL
ncbi:hypothetical protein GLYMA_02G010800v4 [Glycine max]|uniref:Uncharacterized protein n=1 Tax=Glycine max TaxID=3847 RepID=A0A0R0KQC3_SOYBN|nr:hypothetical protein GYH30_002660 [Glycine max]KRH69196.1 hypothetical protein GLYMA_02G010800v4 [Glycine max]